MKLCPTLTVALLTCAIWHPHFASAADGPVMAEPASTAANTPKPAAKPTPAAATDQAEDSWMDDYAAANLDPMVRPSTLGYIIIATAVFTIILGSEYLRYRRNKLPASEGDALPEVESKSVE